LEYIKTSFDKKKQVLKNKNFSKSIFSFNVLVFNNLFYSLGLRHMFISKVLPAMGMD